MLYISSSYIIYTIGYVQLYPIIVATLLIVKIISGWLVAEITVLTYHFLLTIHLSVYKIASQSRSWWQTALTDRQTDRQTDISVTDTLARDWVTQLGFPLPAEWKQWSVPLSSPLTRCRYVVWWQIPIFRLIYQNGFTEPLLRFPYKDMLVIWYSVGKAAFTVKWELTNAHVTHILHCVNTSTWRHKKH